MGPEQGHGSVPETAKSSTKSKASSSRGLISHVAKLMGKTAGLAQATGVKTADSILAAGRQAGKLLHVPSKLRSIVGYETEKKRQVEFDFEIERLRRRIERLYTRIGERICHSPLIDRSILSTDPQIEALVSTVRDLEFEVTDLQQRDPYVPVISRFPTPERAGSVFATERTEPHPGGESQAGDPPQADNAPPSSAQ